MLVIRSLTFLKCIYKKIYHPRQSKLQVLFIQLCQGLIAIDLFQILQKHPHIQSNQLVCQLLYALSSFVESIISLIMIETYFQYLQKYQLFIYLLIISLSISNFIIRSLNNQYIFMRNQNQKSTSIDLHPNREKYGWLRTFVSIVITIVLYQASMYAVVGLIFYAIWTLNYQILMVLVTISVLQSFVNKNQPYIRMVKRYIVPLLYLKKFMRYYQEPIDPNTKCLFALHPHSVIAFGVLATMNANDDIMSSMVGLSSRFALNLPVIGLLLRMWGFKGANPQSLIELMEKGKPIGLLPGGFQQATLTTPKQLRLFIKERKGFIKYSIKHNYTIYPTLIFNEHKALWTFDYLLNFRLFLNKLKIPAVYYFGKYGPFITPGIDIFVVVGKGIKCSGEPTNQLINQFHNQYINEIKRIYDKYQTLNQGSPLVLY